MRRSRRQSHYARSRRRKNNSFGVVLFLLVVGFFLWAVFTFVATLFGGVSSESTSADLEVLNGRAEFLLTGDETWSPAFGEQKFFAGESIRTSSNAHIALNFLEGHTVFLGNNTEVNIKTLEKKNDAEHHISLDLKNGSLWVKVSEDLLAQDKSSSFEITTPKTAVTVNGTLFALDVQPQQETVRLIKGSVTVDVMKEGESIASLPVSVGQKLVINDETLAEIKAGADTLAIIDNEFIESEWHLSNLDRFAPQEAAGIRRKIELAQPLKTAAQEIENKTNEEDVGSDDVERPVITEPANNAVLPASQDAISIEGTAPLEAFQIEVNGYTLTKFSPGDRKWTYFGATKFGTLVSGENKYSVVAITRDGKRSKPATINVTYEGSSVVQPSTTVAPISQFAPPVVTSPAIFSNGAPDTVYQTSASVVTFSGTVPNGTNAVQVNGFQLRKFQPGNTKFSYIANASLGNMKEGENSYTILAIGPDGKSSQTQIKIFYSPLDI